MLQQSKAPMEAQLMNRIRNALYDVTDWMDGNDLSGVGAALDVLATAIIREGIVSREEARRARAQSLSDILYLVLEQYESGNDDLELAAEASVALEECVSAHNYGEYTQSVLESAESELENLTTHVESWLEIQS